MCLCACECTLKHGCICMCVCHICMLRVHIWPHLCVCVCVCVCVITLLIDKSVSLCVGPVDLGCHGDGNRVGRMQKFRFFFKIPWSDWMGKKCLKKSNISESMIMIMVDSQLRRIFCGWMEWIRWKMQRELRSEISDQEGIIIILEKACSEELAVVTAPCWPAETKWRLLAVKTLNNVHNI